MEQAKKYRFRIMSAVMVLLLMDLNGCSGCNDSSGQENDASVDAQDKQKDASDADADSDADSDSDTDIDTDTDTDTDSDTDAGCTGWCPPKGCARLYDFYDSTAHTIRSSWSEDYVVWHVWEEEKSRIYVYNIGNGDLNVEYEIDSPLYSNKSFAATSTAGGKIFWNQPILLNDGGVRYPGEIHEKSVGISGIKRLTDNTWGEWCYTLREDVLYCWYEKTGEPTELRVLYADSGQEKIISQNINLNHTCIDGDDHYVVFCEEDAQNRLKMMLYDEADGGPAAELGITDHVWVAIDDEKIYYSKIRDGASDLDIWVHDIKTGQSRAVISEPGKQWYADVDGKIMMYKHRDEDTDTNPSHIYIHDIETGERRRFTPLYDMHNGLGIHGKYISFHHLGYNDAINEYDPYFVYVCDLEEGGFVDSDGHLIPEDAGGRK